jgi:peptide/nickel transport system substrate-binding protein
VAAAEQQALSRAGINLTLRGYSSRTFDDLIGTPNYVHQHDLGLAISGWAPDWPDGFGFLYFLTAGPAIRPAGTTNIEELNDPVVMTTCSPRPWPPATPPHETLSGPRSTGKS